MDLGQSSPNKKKAVRNMEREMLGISLKYCIEVKVDTYKEVIRNISDV